MQLGRLLKRLYLDVTLLTGKLLRLVGLNSILEEET